jgi:hypothetical protein
MEAATPAPALRIFASSVERFRRRFRSRGVLGVAARLKNRDRHRAVERAGVHVRQAECRGQRAGDGALSRSHRSVHGDDHEPSSGRVEPQPASLSISDSEMSKLA